MKQIRDLILYKNKERRIITDIDHRGENSRFDTYDAPDEVNVWGTKEALF